MAQHVVEAGSEAECYSRCSTYLSRAGVRWKYVVWTRVVLDSGLCGFALAFIVLERGGGCVDGRLQGAARMENLDGEEKVRYLHGNYYSHL